MDEFFTDQDYSAPQISQQQPPQTQFASYNAQQPSVYQPPAAEVEAFEFTDYSSIAAQSTFTHNQGGENDFNQFEQDETTKRIREEEERVQNSLKKKSKEWNDKNQRRNQGHRQLEEYVSKKEQEKQERAKQNSQKEEQVRQAYNRLKVQQGWHKLISNINVRQGENKGKKDTNRMREAILHRRQDESR